MDQRGCLLPAESPESIQRPVRTSYASSEAEWNAKKSRIAELDEETSLKEVMAIMEQSHGFKATKKMYKSHITKWGLDKKLKLNDVKAIIHQKAQRGAVGKRSVFELRRRGMDMEKVHRYMRARKLDLDEIINNSAPAEIPDLRCVTPPATPRRVTQPDLLQARESFLWHVQRYFRASAELLEGEGPIKNFNPLNGVPVYDALAEFHVDCANAVIAFNTSDFATGGQFLVPAASCIKAILKAGLVSMFSATLRILHFFVPRGYLRIVRAMIHQFREMAALVYPQDHPLNRAWEIFYRVQGFDQFQIWSLPVCEIESDIFGKVIGRFSHTISMVKFNQMMLEAEKGILCPKDEEIKLRKLLEEAMFHHGKGSRVCLGIYFELCNCLLDQGKPKEAETFAQEIPMHFMQHLEAPDGLELLAFSQYNQGKHVEAESTIRKCIGIITPSIGGDDPRRTYRLSVLEQWLTDWGRDAEAQVVRDERLEGLRRSSEAVTV